MAKKNDGAEKPARVNERRRFVGGDKSQLAVVMRSFGKSGFITYVDHKPAGAKSFVRGMVAGHDTLAEATAELDARVASAQRDGWKVRGAMPASAFNELPKPGAAPVKAKAAPGGQGLAFPKGGKR